MGMKRIGFEVVDWGNVGYDSLIWCGFKGFNPYHANVEYKVSS